MKIAILGSWEVSRELGAIQMLPAASIALPINIPPIMPTMMTPASSLSAARPPPTRAPVLAP
jgi:hypothetical protein